MKKIVTSVVAMAIVAGTLGGYSAVAHARPTLVANASYFCEEDQPEKELIKSWLDRIGVKPENVEIIRDGTVADECSSCITIQGEAIELPAEYADGEVMILYRKPILDSFSNRITYTNGMTDNRFYFDNNVLMLPTDDTFEEFEGEKLLCYFDGDTVRYSTI